MDAPATRDGAGLDATADAAPPMTCGANGPEVAPLPSSGMASGGAPIGTSSFSGSCGGMSGAEAIYYVTVTVPLASFTVSTVMPQTTSMPILYVRTTCDQSSTEVGCSAASPARITINNPPMGQTYFIFVDEPMANASGIYAIAVSGNVADGQSCDPNNQAFTCNPRHVCAERTPGGGFHCEIAQCADGVDNDNDGKIDYPHDPGCTAPEDDDEADDSCPVTAGHTQGNSMYACPQCGNGIDDDADGLIDFDPPAGVMADWACHSAAWPSEQKMCGSVVISNQFDANGHAAGSTATGANNFAPTPACAFEALAPDQVFHYRVDQPTRSVTATMVAVSGYNEPILYIRKNNCGDVNSQVACATVASGTVAVTANGLAQYDNLFVFADGEFATGSGGGFTIQLDVKLDLGAQCNPAVTWKHCGDGLKCQNNTCVKTQCADGIDNDNDGKIDYPNDPACADPSGDNEAADSCPVESGFTRGNSSFPCPQCGDYVDNDGDGRIDYNPPARLGAQPDPGCTDAHDPDEADKCAVAPGMPSVMVTDITGMSSADSTNVGGATGFAPVTTGCPTTSTAPVKIYELRVAQAISALEVSTCTSGTSYDTLLYIRKSTCYNMSTPPNEIACNDDYNNQIGGLPPPPTGGICANASSGLESYIKVSSLAAGVYYIFVGGFAANTGNFHLTINVTP
jgi:predicted RNA-binding Zn-ribbon protein involved in translation (DUF1610 family)